MITAKFSGRNTTTAYGLTQWDYGQELALECGTTEILDGSEINFYQGKLSCVAYVKNSHVLVPDLMLQNSDNITAYVYVRHDNSGETILSIYMPVDGRPRPENYVLPEYEEYKRLLPAGGTVGQSLIKKTDTDFDVEWRDGGMGEELTEDQIDEICK